MMAAITASKNGNEVYLLEKNDRLGKKLLITGKGRCNITSSLDIKDFIQNVPGNGRFLYSAFDNYTNLDIINFLKEHGVSVKEERGNRIFPTSDKSLDVLKAFEAELKNKRVKIKFNTKVVGIETKENKVVSVMYEDENGGQKKISANKVILATGGKTYSATGSTGDGYEIAQKLGHTIVPVKPSLVPLTAEGESLNICKQMQGLSLRNVQIKLIDTNKNKTIYEDFGEMLFTHYGVSGPLILSASSYVGKKLKAKELTLKIDLKPALSEEQLDHRVLREFEENQNRQFKNAVHKLFPSKLIPVMIELSGIDPEKKVNVITKEERLGFVRLIKGLTCTLTDLRDYNEAIITKGGIKIKEVDPGTMESKLVKGLHFAGEVLDLDAVTGGFNLQIAWSTAYAAGTGIQIKIEIRRTYHGI